jgi:hypothetical protein
MPSAQLLKAEADLLRDKLALFNQALAKRKKSIEQIEIDYATIGNNDLKTKSELLLDARIAEAFGADKSKKLDERQLKNLEEQVTQALALKPNDSELLEASRQTKELREKFDAHKLELAKVSAIIADLQKKEDAIVQTLGANIAPPSLKVTQTKAKIDQITSTAAVLNKFDSFKKAVSDMEISLLENEITQAFQHAMTVLSLLLKKPLGDLKAASTRQEIERAAGKAGVAPQVVAAALKDEKNDVTALLDSLRKVADSIKAEQVQVLKDIAANKALSAEVIKGKSLADQLEHQSFLLNAQIDSKIPNIRTNLVKNANFILEFKPKLGFFDKKWSDADKILFSAYIKQFTDLLKKNSYVELAKAVADFSKADPSEATMKKVKDETGMLAKKILALFDEVHKAQLALAPYQGFLDSYQHAREVAQKGEKTLELEIESKIGPGPFTTIEEVKEAAKRVINTLGSNFADRINAIFARGLDAQKASLLSAAQIIKDDLYTRLSAALKDFSDALVERARLSAKNTASKSALKSAQKEIAQFLLGASINRLVSLLNKPQKYNKNAQLINLIAQDISKRVSNHGELYRAFLITDEPVSTLVQTLNNQKSYWQFKDSARLFPQAMNYIIMSLKMLLDKDEHTKEPLKSLIMN